jgi:hypothetical protein
MSYTVPEIIAVAGAAVVLVVVIMRMPSAPGWPAAADFKNPDFNPFVGNPRYRPPSCEETAVQWNGKDYRECAADRTGFDAQFPTVELQCTGETKVPDALFMEPYSNTGRLQWVNFTGPISKQPVSALVILPDPNRPNANVPTPVVYALHARDQSYENMVADGSYLTCVVASEWRGRRRCCCLRRR